MLLRRANFSSSTKGRGRRGVGPAISQQAQKGGQHNQALSCGKRRNRWILVGALVTISMSIYAFRVTYWPGGSTSPSDAQLRDEARAKYQHCSASSLFVPPVPPRQNPSEWRKPLWVTSFPASGSASPSNKGDLTKELIDAITGLKQATKNYHVSIAGGALRRCKGISETAACTQGHPYVPIGPETQTDNFQPQVIFSIRNFATAFPASYFDKSIAYHGGKGQAPEEEWRKIRDQYMEKSFKAWQDMIRWWREADYYRIGLFLPFEWLLSTTKGPLVVQQLATLYQQAGFEVAPPEDIPCIWFRMAQKEWQRQEQLQKEEYDYTPGYTVEQRDFMVREFDAMLQVLIGNDEQATSSLRRSMDDHQDTSDQVLISLLREYKEDLLAMRHVKLDHP